MKKLRFKIPNHLCFTVLFLIVTIILNSCGYSIVGSQLLPFDSVTINPVLNETYEPKIEEKMHDSLSNEFINQGISVKSMGGDVQIETTVTTFLLGAIGAVDETIKEQELIMKVDIRVVDEERVIEFRSMQSPIKITFQSTGTVSESVAEKERATLKACREIATEIVGRIILSYAK